MRDFDDKMATAVSMFAIVGMVAQIALYSAIVFGIGRYFGVW